MKHPTGSSSKAPRDVVVHTAEFAFSVGAEGELPPQKFSEIALLGRSNVGKSSFLNRLTARRKLAHVSRNPGRTRGLNFFDCEVSAPPSKKSRLYLVDFPGFGFAHYSKEERERMNARTVDYIVSRKKLKAVLLLVDPKRGMKEDEEAIVELMQERSLPLFLIATKMDRFKPTEYNKVWRQFEQDAQECGAKPLPAGEHLSPAAVWTEILRSMR